ncbi:lipopolysaccharide heptosyltransferase II [Candidatus Kryptonium thompsonii]|nr:lipopolysaccharide heptosyltransferase II [Candidatus Kryptonium thompsoni]
MNILNWKRILIIQTAFIGDVVLALPLLQVLRKNFPSAKIDFMLIPRTAELLKNHPDVNDVIIFDKKGKDKGLMGIIKMVKLVSQRNYDAVFIPHRHFRSAIIPFLAGIKIRVGFDKSVFKFLYTHVVKYKQIHEIERNLSLLEPFGIKFQVKELPNLYPSEYERDYIDRFISNVNSKLICIAPGSVWATKRWLKERFAELVKLLIEDGFVVALVGGVEDFELCEEIKNMISSENVFNFCGKLSLLQSAELLRRSILLVSNDSAPMHIAVAMRTPVVAIFGSTIPEFGFYPYGEKDKIVQVENLYCRPCGIHGRKKCPEGHFKCMKLIETEKVYSAVKSVIQSLQ